MCTRREEASSASAASCRVGASEEIGDAGSTAGGSAGGGEGLRPHLGEKGLLEGCADDLGAHVGVLEVRHTGDAPVRLQSDRGERIFFQPLDGRRGNGRARAGAERGEREARNATFEEPARAPRAKVGARGLDVDRVVAWRAIETHAVPGG